MTPNYQKVFSVFRNNYVEIPLEIFKTNAYKTLVSTMMSARTKDEVTLEASKRLFKKAPNIKKLSYIDTKLLSEIIYPVGFYNTKAKHLKELSGTILSSYDGKIPDTREELMKLQGVGRKTANLVLNRAFGIPAIAVDTHVHRITNILGWVKTKTPEQTEKELVKTVPEKYWPEINKLFVSIGRQFGSGKKLREFLNKEKLIYKNQSY